MRGRSHADTRRVYPLSFRIYTGPPKTSPRLDRAAVTSLGCCFDRKFEKRALSRGQGVGRGGWGEAARQEIGPFFGCGATVFIRRGPRPGAYFLNPPPKLFNAFPYHTCSIDPE